MTYKVIPDPTGMSCTIVASPSKDTAHGYDHDHLHCRSGPRCRPDAGDVQGPSSDHLYVRLDPLAGGTGGGGTQNAGGNTALLVEQHNIPVAFNTNTTTDAVNRDYAVPTYMALESSSGFSSAERRLRGLGQRRPEHARLDPSR